MFRISLIGRPSTRDRFELRFAQRSVKAHLCTDGIFAPSPNGPAALAFLDLDTLAKRRDRSVDMPTGNRMNPPVVRIRDKKRARIRPIDKLYDPYVAAVLIGLAQAQRHAGTPPDTRHTPPMSAGSDLDPSVNIPQDPLGSKVFSALFDSLHS
jgi:hypothetical protein